MTIEDPRVVRQSGVRRRQAPNGRESFTAFVNALYDTPMASVVSEESLYVVRAGETPQDGTRLEYRPEPRDLPLFIRGDPNRPDPWYHDDF